jgi:hypothetical protein
MKMLKTGLVVGVFALIFSGCTTGTMKSSSLTEALKGRKATIQTYDVDSHIIDQISRKSIVIGADSKFDLKDSEGSTVQKSSVIGFTVDNKSVTHVGSSLTLAENDLVDLVSEFSKTVDIEKMDRSTPFINQLAVTLKPLLVGKSKIILIRSQTGKPLAAYAGTKVSYFATDIDKSTAFMVDGKLLFVYRCDYTSYDIGLLSE